MNKISDVKNDHIEQKEQTNDTERLIRYISSCSDFYGDKLLEFMEERQLTSLRDATKEDCEAYIQAHPELKPTPKVRVSRFSDRIALRHLKSAPKKEHLEFESDNIR